MNAQGKTWAAVAGVASIAVAVVACSGARTGAVAAGQGQLAINLVDAPNPAVDEIWVTVERVVAHSVPGGWVTVSTTPVTVDLLKLQSQTAALGLLALPAGTITQIRLVVAADGNYVVTGGVHVPLKVPSGCESGIKIIGPWQLPECNRTDVTLDFDGKSSIHLADTGDAYNLRPVIRAKKSATIEVGCKPPSETDAGSDTPPPAPAGADTSCTANSDCLSASCTTAGKCAQGGGGVPCGVPADCISGACSPDHTCTTPVQAGGAGAACNVAADCQSNSCSGPGGTCQPSAQGYPCSPSTPGSCQQGFVCSAGTCIPTAG